MVDKILDGKLNKRLAEICLANQSHSAEEGAPVIEKHRRAAPLGSASRSSRWASFGVGLLGAAHRKVE